MNAVTLTKKQFNGGSIVLDKGGEWVSNGNWALRLSLVRNAAIFKDKATCAAALGENVDEIREASVDAVLKPALARKLQVFRRTRFSCGDPHVSNATGRVYQTDSGRVAFLNDKYTFDLPVLYGDDNAGAFLDDEKEPALLVMPIRVTDKEASPFVLAETRANAAPVASKATKKGKAK